MSRFYINIKERPKVIVEFTEDLIATIKPSLQELFGVAFLAAEERIGDLLRYEFTANEVDFEIIEEKMRAYYESKIVKDADIVIDLN